MRQAISPYLTYSFALHCALLFVAVKIIHHPSRKSNPVYTIDFIGPSTIKSFKQASSTKRGSKAKAPSEVKEYAAAPSTAPSVRRALPPPSFTTGKALPRPPETAPVPAPAPPEAAPEEAEEAENSGAESGPAGPSAELATDIPNFPYPWYISQVRASLWKQWSEKMPSRAGECTVVFSLLRDGRLVDLRVEDSSGDASFDLTALAAVQDAAPYPPLPQGFTQPFLKIHLDLVSR